MKIQDNHSYDAMNVAPHVHKVLYEDDKIRVLKVRMKPGDTANMHWHPHSINYVLSDGKIHLDNPDGTSAVIELSQGQVTSTTAEISHAVKNIGETTVETIEVELKY